MLKWFILCVSITIICLILIQYSVISVFLTRASREPHGSRADRARAKQLDGQRGRLFGGNATEAPQAAQGMHAILFWGTISALLGILGQLSGIYKALNVIMRASEISPSAIAMGFAESLTTTITGLLILFFSAIAWFALQARYRQVVEG